MSDRQIMVQILGDAASLERAFAKSTAAANTFEARMDKVGKKVTGVGKTMSRDITLPLTALGVASVKQAQNFDLLISRMVGLGGVSEAQSKKFRQFILDLAPKVGKGPDELANGLYQIVSAGVKGQRALEALTVSAKASAAGLGDTATVADAVTSVMNAYAKSGMTAKTAVDVLSAAVRDGKGEAASFAPVLGKVVAVASQLGVPFDQAAAALAQMTKLGVPADDAATQLSATFSELLKTTPKAEKALEAMGLSSAGLRQELREKGLLATLQTLNEHTKGSSVAMAEAFPNVRALRGVLQLVGSAASGTAQTFSDVKNSSDSLGTSFRAVSKTDTFKMQQDLAQLKVTAVQLGETLAPLADAVAHDASKMAKAFSDLSPAEQGVLIKLAEMAAIGGPLVLVTGRIITATGEIGKLYKALRLLPLALGSGGLTGSIALFMANPEVAGFIAALGAVAFLEKFGGGGGALGAGKMPAKVGSHALQETGAGAGYKVGKQVVSYAPSTGWYISDADTNANGKSITAAQAAKILGVAESQLGVASGAATHGPGSAHTSDMAGRVSGATGPITSGLAAVERFAGGHVNDDFATSGHATNSFHYKGQAADLAVDGAVWNRLFAMKGSLAELFGPWGLYHFGTQFYDKKLQAEHMDHIHVAFTGTAAKWAAATNAAPPSTGDPNYDPLKGKGAKTKWVGERANTIISAQGRVTAMLTGLPKTLDPVEQDAVKHIEALKKKLVPHMSATEYATVETELKKWGKKLHTEISKNAQVAAKAAAEAKRVFDRALSLDVSHILRDFDRAFAAQMKTFDTETSRHLKDMQTEFARKQLAFDRETQRGMAKFDVKQTPEEKAYADFQVKRAAGELAKTRADALAAATTDEERAALAVGYSLDDQDTALKAAADASRVAQDAKTTADQQAYQDDRDAQKQALQDKETDLEQSYQDQRDLQKQGLQDINDDQKTALQQHLDDLNDSLGKHEIAWSDYLKKLRAMGIDTTGLIDPTTGRIVGATSPNSGLGGHAIGVTPFAAGGIVTRPTVALIGEGREAEGVFPLSALGRMVGGSSKSAPTLVLNVIDDATLAARLKPHTDGLVRVVIR